MVYICVHTCAYSLCITFYIIHILYTFENVKNGGKSDWFT